MWSSCSPDFGARSVIDRFAQIEPKVLLAVDGYRYNGKDFDRSETVAGIHEEVGGELVRLGYLDGSGWQDGFLGDGELEFERVPFDHPLWVLYSSGTTGLPKAIVQGQGGILLEHLKKLHLHVNAQEGDRIFWFTTTGWMMWNFLVGCLLTEAAIVLYDGSPGTRTWACCGTSPSRRGVTTFGTSASYIASCMKAEVEPGDGRDLSQLTAVGSTGSPLSPEGFRWVYEHVGKDTWLFSTSGGTDVCTAFVGGCPLLPVYEGELQARALGCAVESWSPDGEPLIGEVGELVITEPMPSMPIFFWNDPDGERYRESYFDMFPGVWRHGDWIEITERGTAIITGRSDSTINRGGIRMGTAEIYRAVLALDDVTDALVVDIPRRARRTSCRCSSSCATGAELDEELVEGDQGADPRGLLAAARAERDRDGRRGAAHAVGQGARAARQADPPGHRLRTRRRAATRSPIRRRWTSSSSTPGAADARPARPGGSRPSVDSQEPARISSSPAIAPAPGRSPSTAIAERERDDRVDVGDHERPARADLGDQAAEDDERRGRAQQAEHDEARARARRCDGVSVGSADGRDAASGARAAIASETPITARWSRSERWRRSTIGPAA